MFWWVKRLFWNIKTTIRWLPIIWNGFDFDWVYLIKVFQHKLKLMEKFYESNDPVCVDAEKHAKSIKICRILCDRLIADEYHDMLGREIEINWDADLSNNFGLTDNKDSNLKIKGISFKTLNEGCQLGTCKDWSHYDDYMRKRDLELLCKIIQKNLFSWWD